MKSRKRRGGVTRQLNELRQRPFDASRAPLSRKMRMIAIVGIL
jgi:hypothetical protein